MLEKRGKRQNQSLTNSLRMRLRKRMWCAPSWASPLSWCWPAPTSTMATMKTGTLASHGLPLEGVTLILGVDELMDMARTMVNVIGNCLATVVVAKWEGEFVEATDQQLELAAARGEI